MDEVRIETLKRLDLQPGDVLCLKVGGNLGDGDPYIPTVEDLTMIMEDYESVLPGVQLIATHHLVDEVVIRNCLATHKWPPGVRHAS